MVWVWLVQLVDALHFLHNQRILHRDLKPANIFMKRGGHGIMKLGDFGLARTLSSQTDMAQSVVGTPYYLSPGAFARTRLRAFVCMCPCACPCGCPCVPVPVRARCVGILCAGKAGDAV